MGGQGAHYRLQKKHGRNLPAKTAKQKKDLAYFKYGKRAGKIFGYKHHLVKRAKTRAGRIRNGGYTKKGIKVRFSASFHRPKTLKVRRNPKYLKRSIPRRNKMDKYRIIKYPLCKRLRQTIPSPSLLILKRRKGPLKLQ